MKKAENQTDFGRSYAPNESTKFSSFGTRQSFYRRRKFFQTLCLFLCSEFQPRRLFAHAVKTPNSISVIQLSNISKSKKSGNIKISARETFALPLLKQFRIFS